jgi:hypothetical protein
VCFRGEQETSQPTSCNLSKHHHLLYHVQESLLLVLRGAALLSLEILKECHENVPAPLLQAATTLHDNCLLVCAGPA